MHVSTHVSTTAHAVSLQLDLLIHILKEAYTLALNLQGQSKAMRSILKSLNSKSIHKNLSTDGK